MNDVAGWDEIKESLPIGSVVSGVVTRHAPFGVFVKITGVPLDGLIQITDFKDAGRMTRVEFPAIGSSLKTVVLGFKETGRQIWLNGFAGSWEGDTLSEPEMERAQTEPRSPGIVQGDLGVKPSQIDNAEKDEVSMSADVWAPREIVEAAAALRLPPRTDERLQALMDRSTDGILTPVERDELEVLVELSESISLVRAQAFHLLGRRPQ